MSEIEQRIGIEPLDRLHAERDKIVTELAPLRARHGPGGVWEAQRKVEWSKLAVVLREGQPEGKRMTEAEIEQRAHAHDRYVQFLVTGVIEKERYFTLETQLDGIADRINRGQAIARFAAAELGLSR